MQEVKDVHKRSVVARIGWLMGAILSLVYVLSLNWMIGMGGFPDGGITEADLAARPYKNVCLVVQSLCGFYFAYLSLFPHQRVQNYLAAVSVVIAILMVLAMAAVIPWYFVGYLNLDDGRGG